MPSEQLEEAFRFFAEAKTLKEAQERLDSVGEKVAFGPLKAMKTLMGSQPVRSAMTGGVQALGGMMGFDMGGGGGQGPAPMQPMAPQMQMPAAPGQPFPKMSMIGLPLLENSGQQAIGMRSGTELPQRQTSSPVGMTPASRKSAEMNPYARHALMGLGGAGIGAGVGVLSRYMRGPDDDNEPLTLKDYITPALHGGALGGAAGLGASALMPYAGEAYKAITKDTDPPGFQGFADKTRKTLSDAGILSDGDYSHAIDRMRRMQSNAESTLGLDFGAMGSSESHARGANAAMAGGLSAGSLAHDAMSAASTGELGRFSDDRLLSQGAENMSRLGDDQMARRLGASFTVGRTGGEVADNLTRSGVSDAYLSTLPDRAKRQLTGWALDPKAMEDGSKPLYRQSIQGSLDSAYPEYVPAMRGRGIAGSLGKALAPLGLGWLADVGLHNGLAPDQDEIMQDAIRRTQQLQQQRDFGSPDAFEN